MIQESYNNAAANCQNRTRFKYF